MKQRGVLTLAIICILGGTAATESGAGSHAPLDQTLSHGNHDLALRSVSLKEVTVLKINVYWVGLYLETASTPPNDILGSNQVKAFVIHFLRDVKSDQLQEAWIRDLIAACDSDCRSVIAQARVLSRRMPDVHSSQKIAYILFPERVDVLIDGRVLGTLVGANATRAVLATFLGSTSPLKLRNDLIGS